MTAGYFLQPSKVCNLADFDPGLGLRLLLVTQLLLRNPHLSSAMRSLASRVLLSSLLALQQVTPASVSPDPSLHADVRKLVHVISVEMATGTTSVISKALALTTGIMSTAEDNHVCVRIFCDRVFLKIDLLGFPSQP
jgi:hypothetical protein